MNRRRETMTKGSIVHYGRLARAWRWAVPGVVFSVAFGFAACTGTGKGTDPNCPDTTTGTGGAGANPTAGGNGGAAGATTGGTGASTGTAGAGATGDDGVA